jgi:Zn-dependent protease with chaperone function
MDLFIEQEGANRRGGGIKTLSICLMACVVGLVHFLAVLCLGGSLSDASVHRTVVVWTLPATFAVLLVGVIVRVYALRMGGVSLVEELGGTRIRPASSDAGDQLLLRLVEELAFASGVPVPQVWLLERETSINAFAVGSDASSLVVGVTRGALERLTPEELKAVLLHEFSHVLSGDMRLKFQMLAWVQGILFLTLAGRLMVASDSPVGGGFWSRHRFDAAPGSGARRLRAAGGPSDGESQGRSILGVFLMVLGSVSGVFGRFLQGVISRDREFSADSAAAGCFQTPAPIVSALRKIGGLRNRSWIESPTAPESSHLFFGQAAEGLYSAFFPTHPLLEDRIRRLEPQWNGSFLTSSPSRVAPLAPEGDSSDQAPAAKPEDDSKMSAAQRAAAAIGARKREKLKAKELAQLTGSASYPASNLEFIGRGFLPAQLAAAGVAKKSLRDEWIALTRTKEGAMQMFLELMKLPSAAGYQLGGATVTQSLLLADLAMPSLRLMREQEYYRFMKQCRREAVRPDSIDLPQFLLFHVVRRRLGIALGLREAAPVTVEKLTSVWQEAQALMAVMSGSGAPTASARIAAHQAAWGSLGFDNPPAPREGVSVLDMVDALDRCEQASPLLKKRILVACGLAAAYQGQVADREMTLVRLFADAMGSPVPSLLRGRMD